MGKELAVVEKVLSTRKAIDALITLVGAVSEMPTQDLVESYCLANAYEKKISTFTSAVKKELVDNAEQTGRFLSEGTEDGKGHLYLVGTNGSTLKAERRVSVAMDLDKAAKILDELDLTDEGSDCDFCVTDNAKMYDMLCVLLDKSTCAGVPAEILELMEQMKELFTWEYTPSQAKIEALVALEMFPVERLSELAVTSVIYALKPLKK